MATVISGNQVKLNNGQVINAQQGGWYDGQQFWGGTLSTAGTINSLSDQIGAGQKVSSDVVSQTNPNNLSYIDSQIKASDIQSPVSVPYTSSSNSLFSSGSLQSSVDSYRSQLDTMLSSQKATTDAQLAQARQKEQSALTQVQQLTTPFRADLETAQRESLHVNQNFEENQKLVDELDQLLTEGNTLIKQQQSVTGLASIRNPRIQQTMNDVQARAGVIQAVISARNGQIAQAENLIDRSVTAITNDRNDQLNYYSTILNLANRDIVSLDAQSKDLAKQQIDLVKSDLTRAQSTVDYVKQLMLDPDKAALMGMAGVSLNDSVEQINSKLQNAVYFKEVSDQSNKISLQGGTPVMDPSTVPAKQLVSFTDSRGVTHYYKMPATGSSSITTADSFLKTITSNANSSQSSQISSTSTKNTSQPPNYSPSGGVGSVYVDPATGVIWQYKSSGWEKIL